jgi:uncharacterized protein
MRLERKFSRLQKIIRGYKSCAIAFSGGVDSTFLLKAATLVLPHQNIVAVTATSATYPKEELALARRIAKGLGVRHRVIKTAELKDARFVNNPSWRCYYCKKELFRRMNNIARSLKLDSVFDASNLSDQVDFRPGEKALKQLKVRSPLREAGLDKDQIRLLSRKLGLVTWRKPSLACLASRIPYGTKITAAILQRINRAEVFLRRLGFKQVRLRHHNELCRIEVLKNDLPRLINRRKLIIDKLKKLGYNYVALDLEGYRMGSMNEVIK